MRSTLVADEDHGGLYARVLASDDEDHCDDEDHGREPCFLGLSGRYVLVLMVW